MKKKKVQPKKSMKPMPDKPVKVEAGQRWREDHKARADRIIEVLELSLFFRMAKVRTVKNASGKVGAESWVDLARFGKRNGYKLVKGAKP